MGSVFGETYTVNFDKQNFWQCKYNWIQTLNFSKTGQANSPCYSYIDYNSKENRSDEAADGTSMKPLALEMIWGIGGTHRDFYKMLMLVM